MLDEINKKIASEMNVYLFDYDTPKICKIGLHLACQFHQA